MKYFIALTSCLLYTVYNFAQDTLPKEHATGLRADGKIYVVLAVAVTILLGLAIYLVNLDRKISRVEKQNN
jgi:hypothetical protein